MAERRMFAKTIVLSDAFLDMSLGARCLYMTMGMLADDDGFVNSPKAIMRQTGASEDDLKVLIAKKFVLPFESGVIVIKHWRINNYLQKDRIQPTKYQDEMKQLTVEKNGAYTINAECIHSSVYTDKDSIGKVSIGKINNNPLPPKGGKRAFVPPTLEEVEEYCNSRNSPVDPKTFYDYFTAGNWHDSKGNPVKNWKQKLITWEKGDKNVRTNKSLSANSSGHNKKPIKDYSYLYDIK